MKTANKNKSLVVRKKKAPVVHHRLHRTFTHDNTTEWMDDAGVPCSHCHKNLTVFYFNMENWGWGYTEIPLCEDCMRHWFEMYEKIRGRKDLTQQQVFQIMGGKAIDK